MNDTRKGEHLTLKIITIFLKSFSTELRFSTLQEHMFKIIQGRFKLEKAVKCVCETQQFSQKRYDVHCFDMSALNISALSSLSFVSSQLLLLALHQLPPLSNNKHGISKKTILDSSVFGSGQRGAAHMLEILWGARNFYRSQCYLAENQTASSFHKHSLKKDQSSKMDLQNG